MSRFDEWLAANGKVRDYATALDEIHWLREERQRLRLTDEEHAAIRRQSEWLAEQAKRRGDIHSSDLLLQEAATLRGLLERLRCHRTLKIRSIA